MTTATDDIVIVAAARTPQGRLNLDPPIRLG